MVERPFLFATLLVLSAPPYKATEKGLFSSRKRFFMIPDEFPAENDYPRKRGSLPETNDMQRE